MRGPWIIVLFGAAVLCACADKAAHQNAYLSVALRTDGPRGGGYTDPIGKDFAYRIFRVHVTNDSTVPAELAMRFPGGPIALQPDTDKFIRAFLFPDDISPDTAQDVFDFGITGSASFLSARESGPTSLKAMILPGEDHLVYIGVVRELQGIHGLARADLFIAGQKSDAEYFPHEAVPTDTMNGDELDLIFGIAIDPPKHYSIIPCGRIAFKKEK